jgi:transcriptional regulator GlxA family with amidase domain
MAVYLPNIDGIERGYAARQAILRRLSHVFGEIFHAVGEALRDQDSCIDERIKRASNRLRQDPELQRLVLRDGTSDVSPAVRPRGGFSSRNKRLLMAHIAEHLGEPLRNKELAALAGLSESHFCRAFKESFGESPHRYVQRLRMKRARELLLTTDASLGQIGVDCGLVDQAHFCRLFRRFEAQPPGVFRRVHRSASA